MSNKKRFFPTQIRCYCHLQRILCTSCLVAGLTPCWRWKFRSRYASSSTRGCLYTFVCVMRCYPCCKWEFERDAVRSYRLFATACNSTPLRFGWNLKRPTKCVGRELCQLFNYSVSANTVNLKVEYRLHALKRWNNSFSYSSNE